MIWGLIPVAWGRWFQPHKFGKICSKVNHPLVNEQDIANLKASILKSGLTVPQLVSTAWASASTYRGSDKRGGANGARIRLAPQKDWEANNPAELAKVIPALEKIQQEFNNRNRVGGKKVSLADLIVLGGCAAIESAAKKVWPGYQGPIRTGRTDATQEMTDVDSFSVLEPKTDGFRNFFGKQQDRPFEELLVDRSQLLTLTAPEMTVLVGGLRVLNTNTSFPQLGVFTKRPGVLTNDFFVNLLDMNTEWKKSSVCEHFYEGKDRKSVNSNGPAVASISSLDRIHSFEPSPKPMRPMMLKRDS